MNLTNAIVLVTGASRGIGQAIALAFAREGACVVASGRDHALLETLAEALRAHHPHPWTQALELTEPGACEQLVETILARHGRLDVLVNNAGIATAAPVERLTLDEWRRMMAINVEVPMRLTREAVKVMRRQNSGRIINIASDAALRGIGGMSLYCASKHALLGFGRAVNEELRGTPVRLTTLCPGPVTTGIMGGTGNPDAMAPEDVAEAALLAATLSDRTFVAEMLLRPTRLG
jgi:NAD(P)-dependent dehydrogenase (short-subunit alcohol dehydrogenase family)